MLSNKIIKTDEFIEGEKIVLRLVTIEDCNQEYLNWLEDKEVNKYLETRWTKQTIKSIISFVSEMLESEDNYLFAILEKSTNKHIGNIKIGPINHNHLLADVSYFIGDRNAWGKGYATEAIRLITAFGFKRLNLHRIQAGLYEDNIGSGKCLEKAGYTFEGSLRKQLNSSKGWQDHKYFGILREEWESKRI
ncbi:MAG: GNAT family N-acetyltransferase [Ignavibacteriales bacterium]